MNKVRKSYVKNFVQYNMYYESKKALYYQRYIGVFLALFATFITFFETIGWACQEARSYCTKAIFISIASIYCALVIILPIWYRHSKKYKEEESFLLMHIFTDMIGCIVIIYLSLSIFIFPVIGYKTSIVILTLICIGIVYYLNRKTLIERLVVEDGFNVRKKNTMFNKFNHFNKLMRSSPILVVFYLLLGFALKRSETGLTVLGCIISLSSLFLIGGVACGSLQIKYARAYNMQDNLPTKPRKEAEQELAYGNRKNETKQ